MLTLCRWGPVVSRSIYLLWFEGSADEDDVETVALLGCFSERSRAEEERSFASRLPLFSGGGQFIIDEYLLGEIHWTSGFVAWR